MSCMVSLSLMTAATCEMSIIGFISASPCVREMMSYAMLTLAADIDGDIAFAGLAIAPNDSRMGTLPHTAVCKTQM